jgi:hypothetical protein
VGASVESKPGIRSSAALSAKARLYLFAGLRLAHEEEIDAF